jgi:hypothetical protein
LAPSKENVNRLHFIGISKIWVNGAQGAKSGRPFFVSTYFAGAAFMPVRHQSNDDRSA